MSIKEKMVELKLEERTLYTNKHFETEYFTFNKAAAIQALCYLIDNANSKIEIYHKPLTSNKENLTKNKVLNSLINNKNCSITYYTNNISEKERQLVQEYIGTKVNIIDLNLNKNNNVTYHHKEINIDDKYTIITSMNFLTNTSTDGTGHWLENFSIWIRKRSEK